MSTEANDLTTGSVRLALLRMGAPMLLGLGALVSVGVVDAYFLGQLGTDPLAAIGYCFPLMMLAGGFTSGIASGVQSVVSRAVGAKSHETARRIALHAVILALGLTTCAAILGMTFHDPIFEMLGATPDVLPLIREYITVWFGALFFYVTPMVAGSALMARGDALSPTLFMIAGAIINAILDPLLIYGTGPFPELGIAGAAWSSLIARFCVTAGTIFVLFRDDILKPDLRDLGGRYIESWKSILTVALPVALAAFVGPIGAAVATRIISSFGDPAVAAYAGGVRLDSLFQLIAMAMGMGLAPIIGQNWGAELKERVRSGLHFSYSVAIVWGFAAWGTLFLFSDQIAAWFVEGAAVAPLALYLKIAPARYAAEGVFILSHQCFNAIDRAADATVLTVVRVVLLVGALVFMMQFNELEWIFIGLVVVEFIAMILMVVWLRTKLR